MMNAEKPPIFATDYDRAACLIGIVHLGYGAFHRAHQAVYIDDYMQHTGDLSWGIAAVNLRPSESAAFAVAQQGDDGYLLKYTGTTTPTAYRLVRPHVQFADWSRQTAEAEGLIAIESVHAVTITVTESGYYLDEAGRLNLDDPVIRAEVSGGTPQSVYGYLAGGLGRRHAAGGGSLTIMCCDNIRGNGHMLEASLRAYLQAVGKDDLAAWMDRNVTFPCSMVDRITPRTTKELQTEIAGMFPELGASPIHSEDYIQWVLEDRFAGRMPDLTKVGVEVVGDVDPYEEAKIRILNGGHTGLAYLGALAGHDTFDEAMRDPELRSHFDGLEGEEILPGLQRALPFDKHVYCERIAERFANHAIADALERICMDGFSKFPIFVRPTLEGCLAQGISPQHCYASIASWYVFACRHARAQGRIDYHEPNWHLLAPMLEDGAEHDFATSVVLWGDLPSAHADFAPSIVSAIEEVDNRWPA